MLNFLLNLIACWTHILQLVEGSISSDTSEDQLIQLLLAQSRVMFSCIGRFPKYLRLPQAVESDPDIRRVAERLGFIITDVDIDIGAASREDVTELYRAQLARGKESLISVHHERNAQRESPHWRTLIKIVRNEGYNFVPPAGTTD